MELTEILRELLPPEIVDNFDIIRYEKTDERFDIWFDEKKIQEESDAENENIIAYGFGDYKSNAIRWRRHYARQGKERWRRRCSVWDDNIVLGAPFLGEHRAFYRCVER